MLYAIIIRRVTGHMAERRTTDGGLDLGEDVLDLLPDQDCRSPRPISKRASSVACIPVPSNERTERWTDSLLASMKTIGSFRRRSRPDEGASDLIKAVRTTSDDANDADTCAPASAGATIAREENCRLAKDPTAAETSHHTWPLFNESAPTASDPDLIQQQPHGLQSEDAVIGTTTSASASQFSQAKSSEAAAVQLIGAKDNKFAVLAHLLASKEVLFGSPMTT